jgi:hypothetical protein
MVEALLDRARPGWRDRRARKKSPRNLACVLVGLGLAAFIWYYLFQAAWLFHVELYPAHAALKRAFWGDGISARAFVSSFLMLMPLGVPALTLGLLAANLLIWLIPSARHAMDAEAAGDPEMTFRGSNAGLLRWGGVASAVCLVLSIIGLATLTTLH